jgi:hypothetical protein
MGEHGSDKEVSETSSQWSLARELGRPQAASEAANDDE